MTVHVVKMDLVPSEHHQSVRSLTVRLVVLVPSVTHTQIVKIVDHQKNAVRPEDVATATLVQRVLENLPAQEHGLKVLYVQLAPRLIS